MGCVLGRSQPVECGTGQLVAMLPCLIYNFVWMAIHVHAAQRYGHPWKRWEEEG